MGVVGDFGDKEIPLPGHYNEHKNHDNFEILQRALSKYGSTFVGSRGRCVAQIFKACVAQGYTFCVWKGTSKRDPQGTYVSYRKLTPPLSRKLETVLEYQHKQLQQQQQQQSQQEPAGRGAGGKGAKGSSTTTTTTTPMEPHLLLPAMVGHFGPREIPLPSHYKEHRNHDNFQVLERAIHVHGYLFGAGRQRGRCIAQIYKTCVEQGYTFCLWKGQSKQDKQGHYIRWNGLTTELSQKLETVLEYKLKQPHKGRQSTKPQPGHAAAGDDSHSKPDSMGDTTQSPPPQKPEQTNDKDGAPQQQRQGKRPIQQEQQHDETSFTNGTNDKNNQTAPTRTSPRKRRGTRDLDEPHARTAKKTKTTTKKKKQKQDPPANGGITYRSPPSIAATAVAPDVAPRTTTTNDSGKDKEKHSDKQAPTTATSEDDASAPACATAQPPTAPTTAAV